MGERPIGAPFMGSLRATPGLTSEHIDQRKAVEWEPRKRICFYCDDAFVARLDAYCESVNRTRAAGMRHLIAMGLRHFEEATNA